MRGTPGREPVCTVLVTPDPEGEADTRTYTLTSYRSMLSASPGERGGHPHSLLNSGDDFCGFLEQSFEKCLSIPQT